jgi:parvulin-like peptidyl-prolyl isomerase
MRQGREVEVGYPPPAMRPLLAVVTLVASLASLASRPARADPVVIDRVVAVVGPTPLLLSEVRARAAPSLVALDKQSLPPAARAKAEKDLVNELLQHLIDAELVTQAAERARVVATPVEIDRALALIATQNGLSPPKLLEEVQKQGLTEALYREELARQIREAKMLRSRPVPPGVKAADLDEHAHFELLERMRKEWLAELRRGTYVELRL